MEEKFLNAFAYAAQTQDMKMLGFLMGECGSLRKKDKNRLLAAVAQKAPHGKLLKPLIDAGADASYTDGDGNGLLHLVAATGHRKVASFLVGLGLDVNARNKAGDTPLCVAARKARNPGVLKCLLDAGADLSVRAENNENLLMLAAGQNPNEQVTHFLLEQGFDIEERDENGMTALLIAAIQQSNTSVMGELVNAGADIDAKDSDGDCLFHLAAMNPSPAVASYVRSRFLTSERNNDGESCLDFALRLAPNGDVLKVYLEKMREEQIMLACLNESPDVLEEMIESGYGVNTTDADGMSVMMLAAKVHADTDTISMLRYHRAICSNRDERGRTVLHYAAANSEPAIYDFLTNLAELGPDGEFGGLADVEDCKGHKPEYYRRHRDEF